MALLGMFGTGDFASTERGEDWRKGIFELFPNGDTALTGITSMMPSTSTTDPKFHWHTINLADQGGDVTNIYLEAILSTAYVYASHQATKGIEGATVYVKLALALANEFRPGQTVLMIDTDQPQASVGGLVTAVEKNGASSYLAVELSEDDDNHSDSSSYNIATVDSIVITGSAHAEGAERPEAISYPPVEYNNYTQIFRDSLDVTKTAAVTELRTENQYLRAKKEALRYHGIGQERAALWGVKRLTTGSNGKPLRMSQGVFSFINEFISDNVTDFRTESGSDFAGKTWEQAGKKYLDTKLIPIFRFGERRNKLALVGDNAMQAISDLAESYGQIQLVPGAETYGLKIKKWITALGEINLMTHPLFSQQAGFTNTMLILEPKNMIWRPLRKTMYKKDIAWRQGGNQGIDAIQEEWITEGGFEFHHPETFGVMHGLGEKNTQ